MVVELARAQSERCHGLAWFDALERVVDYTAFEQRQHAVGHSLGMQPQMLVVGKCTDYGIGNASHANLQGCTVGDMLGDCCTDAQFGLGGHCGWYFNQRVVAFHTSVDFIDVYYGVTIAEGHGFVDLSYHHFGTFDRRCSQVGADAEAHISVRVGHGTVNQSHVDGASAVAEQSGNFAQEAGYAAAVSFSYVLAHRIRHKE